MFKGRNDISLVAVITVIYLPPAERQAQHRQLPCELEHMSDVSACLVLLSYTRDKHGWSCEINQTLQALCGCYDGRFRRQTRAVPSKLVLLEKALSTLSMHSHADERISSHHDQLSCTCTEADDITRFLPLRSRRETAII